MILSALKIFDVRPGECALYRRDAIEFRDASFDYCNSATHVAAGLFHHGLRRALALSIGAVLGAQVAARLSQHIHGDWIIRSLAIAVGLVGVRLVVPSLW